MMTKAHRGKSGSAAATKTACSAAGNRKLGVLSITWLCKTPN